MWRHAGLLPADSDYRMFSYKHYGSLPGLDIAFLLDGAAYHTDRDTVDRLRPGTLQVRRQAPGAGSPLRDGVSLARDAVALSQTRDQASDSSHIC